MTVRILDASAWREFRGQPSSLGLNKTTHLAKIADETGKLRDCIVKLPRPNTPALLGEVVGWWLARQVQVPCAPFAAVVWVPMKELRAALPLPPEYDGIEQYPAWCCELVFGESVLKQILQWGFAASSRECLMSKDTRAIASFDIWTDLRDRNFGNVIRTQGGKYVAIDHETILHDLLWLPAGIEFEKRSLYDVAKSNLTPEFLNQFISDMTAAAALHEKGLQEIKEPLAAWIDLMYPSGVSASIISLLELRAANGWFGSTIGVAA